MTPFYLQPPGPHWFDEVPRICADFETTNIEHGDPWVPENRIVYTAIAGVGRVHLDVLEEPCVLVAHNAKFELAWLAREGYDIANILPWDTMIAEYVLAGNRRVALDLDSVARRYGLPGKDPVVDALMRGGVCPSEIPAKWIQARGDLDAATTLRIASKQRALLQERGLMSVFFTRCITTPVLALIEGEGMTLNAERVAEEVMRARLKKTEIEAQLVEMSGGINLRSGKQLGEFLYEKLGFDAPKDKRGETLRTKNGHYITNKTALAKLAAKTPQQKEFLKLRAEFGIVDAALSKSLEFFWGVCAEHGGHFRARFNQCVTQTHRLSSSGRRLSFRDGAERGVQFQNLPRTFKRLFRAAAPDHLVVESDGAQLEFRVAGELGQDVQVKQDVEEEADIHRFTASVLKRKPESEVTSKERTAAKAHTFKPLYGGEMGTKREMEYYKAFREKYPGVTATQEGWLGTVLRTKQLRTASGLIFYWPEAKMSHDGYVPIKPSVYNYPIQSFATADIIPISLVYTFWEMKARGIRGKIVNTVHDSVVAEIHKDDVDKYHELVKECWLDKTYRYVDKVYGRKMWVPLGVGFKAGEHWGEGEEIKTSYGYTGDED